MRVTDVAVDETVRGTLLAGTVVWDDRRRGQDRIEFLYRATPASAVVTPGDALTAAVFMVAMAYGEDMVVDAPVSARLVRNTAEIAGIWTSWRPDWRAPSVEAHQADRSSLTPTEIAACFSGGLDSFYTILKPRDEPITTLLSMHGYEVQDQLLADLDERMAGLADAARRLGCRHIVVETNAFRWCLRYLPWSVATGTVHHGACLASMALGLGALVAKCYIAGGEPRVKAGFPWGSHPAVDPLWSTESLEIVHDSGLSRSEKYEIVASSEVALDALHVCQARRNNYANCRRCDKCLMTAYMLHLAGTLDRCSTLGPVSPELIRHSAVGYWHHDVWAVLLARTEDPEYRRAISAALRRARVRKLVRPFGSALSRVGLRRR